MDVREFLDAIEETCGVDAYYGVPDSLLRPLNDEIVERYGIGGRHVVAADEGGAVGLAAGHWLATGHPALVYMQNSGIGNAVNPICSLINENVYAIPVLFAVGWRGRPGVHDEPQHVFQGMCTCELLETVGLSVDVIDDQTTAADLAGMLERATKRMSDGKSAALVVCAGALERSSKVKYGTPGELTREKALAAVVDALPEDAAIVSTTGKLSRELFELREARGQGHEHEFLTVGSMGHSSMIGLGVALAEPSRPIAVLDGDGACLMHTGALAVLASTKPRNLVHVVFNNACHESVGGMPTVSPTVDWLGLASACGYAACAHAETEEEVRTAVAEAFGPGARPAFIEISVNSSSRADLGRPTTTAYDNGRAFSEYIRNGE